MEGKLVVKNFGPIKDATIDLKRVMVFIGPQASGKSTVGRILFELQNVIGLWIIFPTAHKDPKVLLYNLIVHFPENYFTEKTELSVAYLGAKIEIKKKQIRISPSDTSKQKKEIHPGNRMCIPAERTFIPIAAGKVFNLIEGKVPLDGLFLHFGSEFEKAREKVQTIKIDFLGQEYKYENGEDRMYLPQSGKKKFVPLSKSASGIQALIPLLVVVEGAQSEYQGDGYCIIEEPELNLFPPTQNALVKELISKCTSKKGKGIRNLLMTTHSPYVLATLNTLLFAHEVGRKSPAKKKKVAELIPEKSWINPAEFGAYYFEGGKVKSIVNPETRMISENELDGASMDIHEEFSNLMEIYKGK